MLLTEAQACVKEYSQNYRRLFILFSARMKCAEKMLQEVSLEAYRSDGITGLVR
jgi:hypothetical protein